jgi:hypothetical protein
LCDASGAREQQQQRQCQSSRSATVVAIISAQQHLCLSLHAVSKVKLPTEGSKTCIKPMLSNGLQAAMHALPATLPHCSSPRKAQVMPGTDSTSSNASKQVRVSTCAAAAAAAASGML